jgi:hypothetical protein
MEKEKQKSKSKKLFGIEFHWGTGIFIFLMIFLLLFAIFIWFSFQQHLNMVDTNYYPKGLDYEKQITKYKNSASLVDNIEINQDENHIYIKFPKISDSEIEGSILFYYPPDSRKDFPAKIELDSLNRCSISKENLIIGQKYNVLIDWKLDSLEYYFEKNLKIE